MAGCTHQPNMALVSAIKPCLPTHLLDDVLESGSAKRPDYTMMEDYAPAHMQVHYCSHISESDRAEQHDRALRCYKELWGSKRVPSPPDWKTMGTPGHH